MITSEDGSSCISIGSSFVSKSLVENDTSRRPAIFGMTGRDPVAPPAHWDGQRYHVRFPDGSVRTLDPPAQPVVPVPVMLLPTYR